METPCLTVSRSAGWWKLVLTFDSEVELPVVPPANGGFVTEEHPPIINETFERKKQFDFLLKRGR